MNNSQWDAVRRAALGMYPQGEAARSNKPPPIGLDDLPAFEAVCETAGGYGEWVEDPADLPAALARAKHEVVVEGRQARSTGFEPLASASESRTGSPHQGIH